MYSLTDKISVRCWGEESPRYMDGLSQMYDTDGTPLYWDAKYHRFVSEKESLAKDNLTFIFQTEDKTWRQARIQALKIWKLAERLASIRQIAFDYALQALTNVLREPEKPKKPKTFESWFLHREIERMKYLLPVMNGGAK